MKFTKTSAFLLHFGISFVIFSALLLVMYFIWFPGDYFMLDGGWQGIKLIAVIDLILGPALTLLLFKPGKPKLVFDMSIIALIQISALGYGFYAAYHQRTVGLVFAENEFTTISYQDLQLANSTIDKMGFTPVSLDNWGTQKPAQIYTELPTGESFGKYMEDLLNGLPQLRERTDAYKPLNENLHALSKYKLNKNVLDEPWIKTKVGQIAKAENKDMKDFEFYRFRTRYGEGIAILDKTEDAVTHLIRDSGES